MEVIIPKKTREEGVDYMDELKPLAEAWLREARGKDFGLETSVSKHVSDMMGLILLDGRDLLLLISSPFGKPGQIVGYMGLTSFESPLSSQMIANEHCWFVMPEYRGNGLRLIHAAKKWAKEEGCSHLLLTASNLASDLHDEVCTMYEKLKFKKFETSYISEV